METTAETRISIRKKLDAVMRCLRGEPIADVAGEVGARPEAVKLWQERFLRAGRRALGYEFDLSEVPTIEELQDIAQRGFPMYTVEGARRVAGFFAARFYGKNDIVHVYNAGVPDVHLIDVDRERMVIMSKVYPPTWTCRTGDAWALANDYRRSGERFDTVICDCTAEMAMRVLTDSFEDFWDITERYLLCYANRQMLDEVGVEAEPEHLSEWLSRHHGRSLRVADFSKRSSSLGGTYWLVLEKTAAP